MEGNSHKERNAIKEEQERKFEAVVSDEDVRLKKQSVVKKTARSFLAEDVGSVKNYLLDDVFIPALKDTIVDMVQNGIEMLVNGGRGGRRGRNRRRSNDRESYTRYYDDERRRYRDDDRPRRKSDLYDEDDFVFRTRVIAKDVRSRMYEIIEQYDSISVSNLYDLIGKTCPNYIGSDWGWDDLSNVTISQCYDGWWMLNLPRAKYLR